MHTRIIPLVSSSVSAGFPSPAEDHVEANINLHEYLVTNPPATFFVRVDGESMIGAGIHSGDILVVDRSKAPHHEHIVIAAVDGELTVKRLRQKGKTFVLSPENDAFQDIEVSEGAHGEVWGVVTGVVRKL